MLTDRGDRHLRTVVEFCQMSPASMSPFYVLSPGIVVEDCLILLQNLLKNNNSNQNFFKEGSYIQRMKPWFEVGDENSGWSAQKVTNLHLMLQVCMCSPDMTLEAAVREGSFPQKESCVSLVNPGFSVGF